MNRSALVHRISLEPNPALLEHAQKRAESGQNRIADRITAFAGSMAFVYITSPGSAAGSCSESSITRTAF